MRSQNEVFWDGTVKLPIYLVLIILTMMNNQLLSITASSPLPSAPLQSPLSSPPPPVEEDFVDVLFHKCDSEGRGVVRASRVADHLSHTLADLQPR